MTEPKKPDRSKLPEKNKTQEKKKGYQNPKHREDFERLLDDAIGVGTKK